MGIRRKTRAYLIICALLASVATLQTAQAANSSALKVSAKVHNLAVKGKSILITYCDRLPSNFSTRTFTLVKQDVQSDNYIFSVNTKPIVYLRIQAGVISNSWFLSPLDNDLDRWSFRSWSCNARTGIYPNELPSLSWATR